MHTNPEWMNKHLLPLSIDDKRREPEMTPCLQALVNQVTELLQAGLWVFHCVEEFTLRWIRPLVRRVKLVYECPLFTNPTRESATDKILNSFIVDVELIF
jgi:hypothetical protein